MNTHLVYITAGTKEEAQGIARTVVEERLAACANILGGVRSLYHWEGKLCEDEEVIIFLKTTEERLEVLLARIKELHSYACPCIVCMPLTGGNPDFFNWIADETKSS